LVGQPIAGGTGNALKKWLLAMQDYRKAASLGMQRTLIDHSESSGSQGSRGFTTDPTATVRTAAQLKGRALSRRFNCEEW
jgi:hypothetical protein